MKIAHHVAAFLRKNHLAQSPLLLGLSGGSDSLALLSALTTYQKKHPFPLHIAHIDHAWREESSAEANLVEEWARSAGATFHLHRLAPPKKKGNLEDAGRKGRLHFFSKVAEQHQCQALLLAHHGDDQAETVAKRLFEGAPLSRLAAMEPISQWERLTIWRPLLPFTKEELIVKDRIPIDDPTNRDPKFQRSRLRHAVLPTLSLKFGRPIAPRLLAVSKECADLNDFLKESSSPYLTARKEKGGVVIWDFSTTPPPHRYLLQWLLRKEVSWPSPLLGNVLDAFYGGRPDRHFHFSGHTVRVHCYRITLQKP